VCGENDPLVDLAKERALVEGKRRA